MFIRTYLSASFLFLLHDDVSSSHVHPRHHQRRSIDYDDRWFGFRFTEEPSSGVFLDRSIHLNCAFSLSRRRETSVEWKKDGVTLHGNEKRIELDATGTVTIHDAVPSDAGVYQCIVHVSDAADAGTWTFQSRKAVVRLPLPLTFAQQPEDVAVPRGQAAAFRCILEESDGVSVRWLKDGRPVTPSAQYRILPISSTLEIPNVDGIHEGAYSCVAERGGARIESLRSRLTTLTSGEDVELRLILWPQTQRRKEGEKMLLECLAVGGKNVRVDWSKDGQPLPQGVQVGVSSLLISSMRPEHAGTYACKASDAVDTVERVAVITVESAPKITSPPSDAVALETSDVELECFASGRPTPIISWLKNGETLIASEYFVIDANRLRILGVVKADQGVYQCIAENAAGIAQAAAQLLVDSSGLFLDRLNSAVDSALAAGHMSQEKKEEMGYVLHDERMQPSSDDSSSVAGSSGEPLMASAPLGLRVMSVGSREAMLAWDPPLQRHGNLLHYHLYYREDGSNRERVVNSTETRVTLRDLQAGTLYQLRVAAENEAGIGILSETLRISTNKEKAVPGKVRELVASALGPETIAVQWKPPASEGAPPLRYRLFYVRSDSKDTDRETQINVPSTSYTMHGMDKYTEYDIRVEAEGENGPGLTSDTVKSDIPSSPPSDISAEAISSTSIRVSWKKPEESVVNGEVTGYRLKYKTKARGSKGSTVLIESSNESSYTLTGLEPKTAYTIRMAVINNNGTGPYSDWLTAETSLVDKEESILGAPRELKAQPGTDFIQLYWRPPADENILVRGYQIGWGHNVPDVEVTKVESNVLQHKITGLKPGRDYVLSLRAFNRLGFGFPFYETVRTSEKSDSVDMLGGSLEGSESEVEAPLGVRAIALSPTSIRVTWADSSVAFNTLYTVKYTSSSDGNALRFANTTEQFIVIEKLKPATEYEMAVRAFLPPSSLSSWSMAVRNRTLPAPPSSAPRDLTILPAASGDPASVTVNWQPPKYANGEIQEYILFYSDRRDAREDEWNQLVIPGEHLSHPIHSLLPKSSYYFKIQAKNIKGFGPMSSVQVYSPGAAGFVHPVHPVQPKSSGGNDILSANIIELAKGNPLYLLVAAAIILLLGLCVLLITVWICKRPSKPKTRNGSAGYVAGRKTSSQQRTDLWIQHGAGGSQMLPADSMAGAPLGTSLAELKNESPPPRYQMHNRVEEPVYGAVGSSRVATTRRTPPVRSSLSSYDDPSASLSSESTRPLVGRAKPMPSGGNSSERMLIVPPPPLPRANYAMSEADSGGTLSRSYHHSSSSLEASRQRNPHVVYTGHHRQHAKIDLGESPYSSSLGLGPGTPPPPTVAPPQPPGSSEGYRTMRGGMVPLGGTVGGLRSFSQLSTGSPQPRIASLAGNARQVPVGRATAQPRVNVANLCSPFVGSSLSVEDEKHRLREEEPEGDGASTHASDDNHLQPSLSTEQLHAQMENIDHMIYDLQALQQTFNPQS